MELICLDTTELIDYLRNKPEIVQFIELHAQDDLACTSITAFELYYGAHYSDKPKKHVKAVSDLLASLTLLSLNEQSAYASAELLAKLKKKRKMIDFRDALIAGCVINNGYSLKTQNTKHFEHVPALTLIHS